MKLYLGTAIFLSLFILGISYFFAGAISDNFYTALYPVINDYFWAKTIMFLAIYISLSILGFFLIFRKFIR